MIIVIVIIIIIIIIDIVTLHYKVQSLLPSADVHLWSSLNSTVGDVKQYWFSKDFKQIIKTMIN